MDIDGIDRLTRAVFRLGLCELVVPRLRVAPDYSYAIDALASAWAWVQGSNVSAAHLTSLLWDDDDRGVVPPMTLETEKPWWDEWGCVAMAVMLVAFFAHKEEGSSAVPEMLEDADAQADEDEFGAYFFRVFPRSDVARQLQVVLMSMRADEYTRENIRETVFRIARDCGVAVP